MKSFSPRSTLNTRFFHRFITLAFFATIPVISSASSAIGADFCRFYSNNDWKGTSKTFDLPQSGSLSGNSWGATSVRGAGKSELTSAVYENAESVRIRAFDSDVVLYVFSGEHFDGEFQALRVNRGNERDWRYGSMRNKIRSFICQRDDFIPANLSGLTEFLKNSLLPSYFIADPITAKIHASVRSQKDRFYNGKIDLKYGRLSWTTRYNTCREINCASPKTPQDKYLDFLKYSYKATGRLKADGKNYDMYITLWFQPKLDKGSLTFTERAWKVDVSNWIWHNKIQDAIESQVKSQYDGLGQELTKGFQDTIRKTLGNSTGNTIINNNSRLVFSHPCNYYVQRVGYPGHTFTPYQIDNFCDGTTPVSVAAPGIRLLK
jgi:hypothetical protein